MGFEPKALIATTIYTTHCACFFLYHQLNFVAKQKLWTGFQEDQQILQTVCLIEWTPSVAKKTEQPISHFFYIA